MSRHRRAASVTSTAMGLSQESTDEAVWFEDNDVVFDYLNDNSPATKATKGKETPNKPTSLPRSSSLSYVMEPTTQKVSEDNIPTTPKAANNDDMRKLQSNFDFAIRTIAMLQSQLNTTNATIERLHKDLDRVHMSESTAVKAADAAVRTVDLLREQLRVSSQECMAKVDPIDSQNLQNELEKSQQSLSKVQWELDKALSKGKDDTIKLLVLEQKLVEAGVDVSTKASELGSLREKHTEVLQELNSRKEKATNWEAKYHAAASSNNELGLQISALQSQLAEAQSHTKQLQDEATTLQLQLNSYAIAVPKMNLELQQLRNEWVITRKTLKQEIKLTQTTLFKWSQDSTEAAIQHNEREVALEAKHAKIAQWQYQVKAEKLRSADIQQQLWKANALYEKDIAACHQEYERLREHVNVMLGVKTSLASEVRSSLERIQALEASLNEKEIKCQQFQKKNSALVQQVKIMRHTQARELERVLLHKEDKSPENQYGPPSDWLEFLQLLLIYREEHPQR
ncbi:hypothetical protein THRCLA_02556 [Thraustotheca clavata]|uniref:Uncharacterized protein n=1 Tax=Thraustotheca clavata TaxID=74557 RepID=A0A1W0A4T7_9STRA|nr:hypothetical protein THRCLA_02556 [Thraustotheca clavata]